MDILTQIPLGTKFKIKATREIVTLEDIRIFPTRYKTIIESGKVSYYKTYEVERIESTDVFVSLTNSSGSTVNC